MFLKRNEKTHAFANFLVLRFFQEGLAGVDPAIDNFATKRLGMQELIDQTPAWFGSMIANFATTNAIEASHAGLDVMTASHATTLLHWCTCSGQ